MALPGSVLGYSGLFCLLKYLRQGSREAAADHFKELGMFSG